MDLPHILGLAMVLYFVVFSIVDEHRIRTLDDPDREPVTAPPASTPQTRKAEELARNRMDLMKKRKLGHLLLADYRLSSRLTRKDMTSPDSIRKKLDEMFQEMLRYLNLPPTFTVEVVPDEDRTIAPDRDAECNFALHKIRFFLRSCFTPEQLTNMLCHECAHYFCYHYNMYEFKRFRLNELYTDTVACLMGFSKYMIIPDPICYLKPEQMRAVRWTLLQERGTVPAGQAGEENSVSSLRRSAPG